MSHHFEKYRAELQTINTIHDTKLSEMHQTREKANSEIKSLSSELTTLTSEVNVLQIEIKKYEAHLEFLTTEREMVLEAQKTARPQVMQTGGK